MNVDAKLVKDLRERTGAGMMDCKKELVESKGDLDSAVEFLRESVRLFRLELAALTFDSIANNFFNCTCIQKFQKFLFF